MYARLAGAINGSARGLASMVSGVHRSIAYVLQAAIDANVFEGDAPGWPTDAVADAPAEAAAETAADADNDADTDAAAEPAVDAIDDTPEAASAADDSTAADDAAPTEDAPAGEAAAEESENS